MKFSADGLRPAALLFASLIAAALPLGAEPVHSRGGAGAPAISLADPGSEALPADAVRTLAVSLIENRGQLDSAVRFYVQASGKSVYFTPDGVTYALTAPAAGAKSGDRTTPSTRWAVKLNFPGADPNAVIDGLDKRIGIVSQFSGKPSEWKTGLPTYGSIVYRNLWPGIDLRFDANVNHIKYKFVVQPGADPSQIRIAYNGARISIDPFGQLALSTPLGGFHDAAPFSYQDGGGSRHPVASSYRIDSAGENGGTYGFELGEYDRNAPLVIDPSVVVYAGYIGGVDVDAARALAVDAAGNAYVAGESSSAAGFPTIAGPDASFNGGNRDAFVAKISADGTTLLYAGFLGGAADDYATGIAIDAAGNAYVTGETRSNQSSFPVIGGPDLSFNGASDAFVAKVNAAGTALLYSGYIGGAEIDTANAIAVDSAGNAYIAGDTFSPEATFPVTVGPDLTFNGVRDAFVAKVNASGSALSYAGYLGGAQFDIARAIAVDAGGSAYVAGETASSEASFPVSGGPDLTFNGGSRDAFVAQVAPGGAALSYAGYVGGAGDDIAHAIAVNAAGEAFLAGETSSTEANFPILRGPGLAYGGGSRDAFAAKVNPGGGSLFYSGFIGGVGTDIARAAALDDSGSLVVSGATSSTEATFPVVIGPAVAFGGVRDAFASKVNPAGTGLLFSGYFGGAGDDAANAVALDAGGNLYLAGSSSSSEASFPVVAGPDLTSNGSSDAFVAKISVGEPHITAEGFVNAASYKGGPIAPGEIISIFGTAIGPQEPLLAQLDSNGRVATTLGNTTVFFGSDPGALFYVSDTQINVQAPYSIDGASTVEIRIQNDGFETNTITVPVASSAPGIFTTDASGSGQAAAVDINGNLNTADNAAGPGDIIIIFATGEGQTDPAGLTGKLAEQPFPVPVLPVKLLIGGIEAQLLYAGAAPGFAGLLQINAIIPAGIASLSAAEGAPHVPQSGSGIPVELIIGENSSQPGIFLNFSGTGAGIPSAFAQALSTNEDTALAITLSGADPADQPLAFSIVNGPAHGSLSAFGAVTPTSANLVYTPSLNYNGPDTFQFRVTDPDGNTATATVGITVNPVNDPPVAVDDFDTASSEQTITVNVRNNDSDPDHDPLTVTSVSAPTQGSASTNGSTVSFTAPDDFTGTATFTYVISDGELTDSASVTVSPRSGSNDAPTAFDQSLSTLQGVPLDLTLTASDPDGDSMKFRIISGPSNGTLLPTTVPVGQSAPKTYTPNPGFVGTDSFVFEVDDDRGGKDTATVTIEVLPGVDLAIAKTAMPDPVLSGSMLTYQITVANNGPNDTTGVVVTDTLSPLVTLVSATPSQGGPCTGTTVVTCNLGALANGGAATVTIVVTVNLGLRTGFIPNTASVSSGLADSNPANNSVTINTGIINEPPVIGNAAVAVETVGNTQLKVAQAQAPQTVPEVFFQGDLLTLANVTDINGDPLTFSVPSPLTTNGGSVTITNAATGEFTYLPPPGNNAPDSFTYQVADPGNPAVDGMVNITLSGRIWYVKNDQPGMSSGTSVSPFSTLADAEGASAAGDDIFVHFGDGMTTGQSLGITLKNNQRLIGEGVALDIDLALNGGTAPTPLFPAGTHPLIDNTAAASNGVTAADVTGIEVRGVNAQGTSNGIWVTCTTGAVDAVVSDNIVRFAGQVGLGIFSGGTCALRATVEDNNITAALAGLNGTAANSSTLDVAFNRNVVAVNDSPASIPIAVSPLGGSPTVRSFDGNRVSGTSGGMSGGIFFDSVLFDADPSTPTTFEPVPGGATVIGDTAGPDPFGGPGMVLNNVSGNLEFTSLSIEAGNGFGLQANGTGVFTPGPPASGFRLAIGGGVIHAQDAPALELDPLTAAITLGQITSLNSTASGVSLTDVNGSVTINDAAPGSSITSPVGPPLNINGGDVAVTYHGDITNSNIDATVVVQQHTGSLTFGPGSTITATNGTGLQFSDADGTYNFNGTTTLNGDDAGIDILSGSDGDFTFSANTTITNPAGAAFSVDGGNGVVTYNGTISQNANAARVVEIANRAGGSVTFGGAITSDAPGEGISITGGTAANTVNFNGAVNLGQTTPLTSAGITMTGNHAASEVHFNAALNIATNGADGIVGTTAGMLTTTSGAISATNGTALNIDGLDFGPASLNFNPVSAANTGSQQGINLQNFTGTAKLGVVTLNTNTGTALNLLNGGTVTTVPGSTITATAAQAIVANNVDFGFGSLHFNSINASSSAAPVSFTNAKGRANLMGGSLAAGADAAVTVNLTDNSAFELILSGTSLATATANALAATADGASSLCLSAAGNSAEDNFLLQQLNTGAFNVVQQDAATLSALNGGVTVNQSGTIGFGAGCLSAPIPGDPFGTPPTANPDSGGTILEAGMVDVDVVANDVDPDPGDALFLSGITTPPTLGTATILSPTTIRYTQNVIIGVDSMDSFVYQVVDKSGNAATATVSLNITNINDPPMIGNATISYEALGNTALQVGGTQAPPSLFLDQAADSLITKAAITDNDGPGPFTCSLNTQSAMGAVVSFEPNSCNFSYTPTPGVRTGTESFTYTVNDGSGAATCCAMGTVEINIAGIVWYVKNDALTDANPSNDGNTGTSLNPFATLAQADGASDGPGGAGPSLAGDVIYVFRGDGTTANQNAGIILRNMQNLRGSGAPLQVTGTFNGAMNPTLLPLDPAGPPLISNPAGPAVLVDNAADGGGDKIDIEIVGLNLTGEPGVLVECRGTNDTSVVVNNNALTATSSPGFNSIAFADCGTNTVSINNNVTQALGGGFPAIEINGTAGGATYITSFANNSATGASASGVNITGATFDANPATAVFEPVNGGATVIGASGDPVTTVGMILSSGVSGELVFTDLDIFAASAALLVNGSGVLSPASPNATSGFGLTTPAGATLNSTSGAALLMDPLTANMVFDTANGTHVALTDISGVVNIPGGALAGTTGTPTFKIDGGDATVTYGGSATAGSGARVVDILDRTGGSVTLGGALTSDGPGQGISITGASAANTVDFNGAVNLGQTTALTSTGLAVTGNHTDTEVHFNAALNITTNGANGIVGTAAGTLTTTSGAISATNGTALDIAGLGFGPASLNFDTVSAANSGAQQGINLQNFTGTAKLGVVTLNTNTGTALNLLNGGTVATVPGSTITAIAAQAIVANNVDFGFGSLHFNSVVGSSAAAPVSFTETRGRANLMGGSLATTSTPALSVSLSDGPKFELILTNTALASSTGTEFSASVSGMGGGFCLSAAGNSFADFFFFQSSSAPFQVVQPEFVFSGLNGVSSSTQSPSVVYDTNCLTAASPGDPFGTAPVAMDDSAGPINEGSGQILIDVIANDTDADIATDGDALFMLSVSNPTMGGFAAVGSTTQVAYTPPIGLSADIEDTFTYEIIDKAGNVAMAQVTVTVLNVNDPPVIATSPLSFDALGNTALEVNTTAQSVFPGLYVNSNIVTAAGVTDPDGPAPPFTCAVVPGTEPPMASLTVNADCSFTYTPPAGFAGTQSFHYTVDDGSGTMTSSAQGIVELDVAGSVWYVKNDHNGGTPNTGTGTSTDPFTTLADADGASDGPGGAGPSLAGDIIYVFRGDGLDTNQNAGIILRDMQKLRGSGAPLVATGTFNGVTDPVLLPIDPSGPPLLSNAAGAAVLVDTAADGGGNKIDIEIVGLSLTGVNPINVACSGTFNTAVTAATNTLSGTGNGFNAVNQATCGTTTIALNSTVAGSTTGSAIFIDGSLDPAGLFVQQFSGNSVPAATAGNGIVVRGAIFDADPSTAIFNAVSAGNTVVAASGMPAGGIGMQLGDPTSAATRVSGELVFTDLDIFATGTALSVAGSGVLTPASPSATSGFGLTTPAGATLSSTSGAALIMDPLTASTVFDTANGTIVSLTDVAGVVNIPAGALAGAAGLPTFKIDGGDATVTYGGSATAGSGGRVVDILDRTGGSATFGGAITSNSTGLGISIVGATAASTTAFNGNVDLGVTTPLGSTGVSINHNATSSTTSFANLDIATNGATGLTASNGGTLGITTGTVASTGGTAVNISGTNTSTFTLASVTQSGAAAGNGINISTSTGTKNFTFASIANTSGMGVALLNAGTVNIDGMSPSSSINTTGNTAFSSSGTALGVNFASTTSTGGVNNILLTNASGSANFGMGALTSSTGNAFVVNGGSAAISYAGSITNGTAGDVVNIQNTTGGSVALSGNITDNTGGTGITVLNNNTGSAKTITFSGATKTLNTGTNAAVDLNTNTNATISFTNGGLDIDTTTGIGFSAVGGGTVNVSGANNTVATSSGQAVDIDSVTTGITFASLSSTNSTTHGVDLSNLGANSAFNGGTTTITNSNATGALTNGALRILTVGNGANIDFGTTAVNSRNGTGIFIDSVSASGGSPSTIDFGAVTIPNPDNSAGYGIRIEDSGADVTIASATISNTIIGTATTFNAGTGRPTNDGDGDGIFLKNNTGEFSFALNGGTFTNIADNAVDFRTTNNVTLNGITIGTAAGNGTDNAGLMGDIGTNLSVLNSNFAFIGNDVSPGTLQHDNGMTLRDISGTLTIQNTLLDGDDGYSTFQNSITLDQNRAVELANAGVNLNVVVTDSTIRFWDFQGLNLRFIGGSMNVDIGDNTVGNANTFTNINGAAVSTGPSSGATTNAHTTDVLRNTFTNVGIAVESFSSRGGDSTVRIVNNTVATTISDAFRLVAFANGVVGAFPNYNARVTNNTVTNLAGGDQGDGGGAGFFIAVEDTSNAQVLIDSNSITGHGLTGPTDNLAGMLTTQHQRGGNMDITFSNNTAASMQNNAFGAMFLQVNGTDGANSQCINFSANTYTNVKPGAFAFNNIYAFDLTAVGGNDNMEIHGFVDPAPPGATEAEVAAYLNGPETTAIVAGDVLFFGAAPIGGTCLQASVPPAP